MNPQSQLHKPAFRRNVTSQYIYSPDSRNSKLKASSDSEKQQRSTALDWRDFLGQRPDWLWDGQPGFALPSDWGLIRGVPRFRYRGLICAAFLIYSWLRGQLCLPDGVYVRVGISPAMLLFSNSFSDASNLSWTPLTYHRSRPGVCEERSANYAGQRQKRRRTHFISAFVVSLKEKKNLPWQNSMSGWKIPISSRTLQYLPPCSLHWSWHPTASIWIYSKQLKMHWISTTGTMQEKWYRSVGWWNTSDLLHIWCTASTPATLIKISNALQQKILFNIPLTSVNELSCTQATRHASTG